MIIPTAIKRAADRALLDALEDIIEKCPESATIIIQAMEDAYDKLSESD